MPKFRIALALIATLLVAGCYPVTSTRPAGTTAGLSRADALIGTWTLRTDTPEEHTNCVVIFAHGRQTSGTIGPCGAAASDRRGKMEFDLTSATVAGKHLLNATLTAMYNDSGVRDVNVPPGVRPIPLLYTRTGNTLTIYQLDESKFGEAVEAGLIEAQKNSEGDWVITASAERLDAFLTDPANAGRFRVMMVLDRAG